MQIEPQNDPRALATVNDANSIVEVAEAYEITDQTMYEMAGNELGRIKAKAKQIDAIREDLKRPILEAGRKVDAFFRTPLDALKRAEDVLKGRMLTYSRQIEADRRAREEAARRAAEEAARAEREAAEKAAAEAHARAQAAIDAGDVHKAAEETATAHAVVADAQIRTESMVLAASQSPASVAPIARGIGIRDSWKAQVVDFHALVRAAAENPAYLVYLQANEQALGALARSAKSAATVPGVAFENVGTVTARAG